MKQVVKTGKDIKHCITLYNEVPHVNDGLPEKITFENAVELNSYVWQTVTSGTSAGSIPRSILIKGNNLLHSVKRAEEEKGLVEVDIACYVQHQINHYKNAEAWLEKLADSEFSKDRAAKAMLLVHLCRLECIIDGYLKTFGHLLDFIPSPPAEFQKHLQSNEHIRRCLTSVKTTCNDSQSEDEDEEEEEEEDDIDDNNDTAVVQMDIDHPDPN